jgi:hypothetical protein
MKNLKCNFLNHQGMRILTKFIDLIILNGIVRELIFRKLLLKNQTSQRQGTWNQ